MNKLLLLKLLVEYTITEVRLLFIFLILLVIVFLSLSEVLIGLSYLFLEQDLRAGLFKKAVEVAAPVDRSSHVERAEHLELLVQVAQTLAAELEHLHVVGKVGLILLLLLHLFLIMILTIIFFLWIVRNELERRGCVHDDIEVAEPAFLEELDQLYSDCFTIVLVEETVKIARAL